MDLDHSANDAEIPVDNPHAYLFSDSVGETVHTIQSSHSHLSSKNDVNDHKEEVHGTQNSVAQKSLKTSNSTPIISQRGKSAPVSVGHSVQSKHLGDYDERFKLTSDYTSIMKTILKLKDQRAQAMADLKKLESERLKSSRDPRSFVNNLLLKKDVIPRRQHVVSTPSIEFELYESLSTIPDLKFDFKSSKKSTSKSASFNLPWTAEEQKRLEELLIEYPDEPVAASRCEKIARALGNRTPKQVQSRIQKYFQKLAQEGLPVPGRVPHVPQKEKNQLVAVPKDAKNPSVYTQHINYLEIPTIKMIDAEDTVPDEALLTEEEQKLFAGLHDTLEYKELIQLKRLKRFQARTREVYVSQDHQNQVQKQVHHGSSCASCAMSPIVGHLYRCLDCSNRIELCSNCHNAQIWSNGTHLPTHRVDLEQASEMVFVDNDYAFIDEMNYLDPNYMAN